MQLGGDVTDGRDFILVWTTSVQDTLRRIMQLLYCIKSHALNKCTFDLGGGGEFPYMRKYNQQGHFNFMLFI